MDSLLLELDKVKTGSDRRKEVLSWREELEEARSKWEPAPQTARALKPLSVRTASEREVRRPARCVAKRTQLPAVAKPVPQAEATSLQQRNAALEMAVLALGEALEASGGGPTADLQTAMDRLHATGVNISSAASYVPFSPAQVSAQARRAMLDEDAAIINPMWTPVAVGSSTRQPSSSPSQSDVSASPVVEEPEWLVDAAATLAAAKGPAAR